MDAVVVVVQQEVHWRHPSLPFLAHAILHGLEERELVVRENLDQKIDVPVEEETEEDDLGIRDD